MLVLGRTIVILILEFIIEYLFGTMLTKLLLRHEVNPLMSLLMGFIAYQALFQIFALAFIVTTGVLHHLTITWLVALFATIVLSLVVERETILTQLRGAFYEIKEHKKSMIFVILIIITFCYYVSINGENNEDARYYIALMTTSVETDTMFKYNVYNGYQIDSLYLRRALATFEIHSAVLSQLSGIHPLIIARVFRACQNVILTSAAVILCGKRLFWENDENAIDKAFSLVIAFWFIQILFSNTFFTSGTFALYRAYEAKAFTANVIVLLGMYLCLRMLRERKGTTLVLIVIFIWGSMAISMSAMMIALAECMLLLFTILIYRFIVKKIQERLHAG